MITPAVTDAASARCWIERFDLVMLEAYPSVAQTEASHGSRPCVDDHGVRLWHVAATMQTLAQAGDPVYRVTVRLKDQRINAYGTQHALKPGMLAEADIVQDTRKLWEWALEPLFSVSGKVLANRGESSNNISSHALIESTRKGSI